MNFFPYRLKILILVLSVFLFIGPAPPHVRAQNGVMMQYFHWYYPAGGLLWDEVAGRADELAAAGITALWLPPAYKGTSQFDVGYDVYDLYDLGEFDQKGAVRTKYGTKDREWLEHVRATERRELFAVDEFWSGNIEKLKNYITKTEGMMSLFDAPLHYNFQAASQAGGNYDMSKLMDNTLMNEQPLLAVTLVENHDTQPCQALESPVEDWFKPLAYAFILLRQEGYPNIFYPDWSIALSDLPADTYIEWKCIKRDGAGQLEWQPGENNKFTMPASGTSNTSGSF